MIGARRHHPGDSLLRLLGGILRTERSLLLLLLSYAGLVALLSLIIPLTMQELINTFSYAIQPVMVVTLSSIMTGILLLVGGGKVLQYCAVEMLERRVFARIALGMAHSLPDVARQVRRPQLDSRNRQ
jgi:ABC-type multidrug transport system fused ATPase/permease subunit